MATTVTWQARTVDDALRSAPVTAMCCCHVDAQTSSRELAGMRTTIDLDEDAPIAARHIARRERLPMGEAVSALVRRGCAAGESGF